MKKLLIILTIFALLQAPADARRKKAHKAETTDVPTRVLTAEQQEHFDALYFEAIAMQQYGHTDQAFALMQQALQIDSLSAPALYYMTDVYKALNKPYQALACIRQAVASDRSNSYWYQASEGDLLMQMNKISEAADCYKSLSERFQDKSEPLYSLAEAYLRMDSAQKCYDVLEKIENIDGVSPNITLQKFYLLQQLGKGDEAFAEYDKLIARYPYDMSYRIQKGDLQMKNGQIDKAKSTYDETSRLDPDNAYIWVALSNYYNITGDQQEADTLVRNALVNANLDIDTKIKILTEYLKNTLRKVTKGQNIDSMEINLPEVDSLFLTIEQMHPTAPEVYDLHADYLSAIHEDSLAYVQMRYACDLKPADKDYWAKLLSIASETKNFPWLLTLCDDVEKVQPDLPDISLMRAYVYAQDKRYTEEIEAYEKAIAKIDPTEVNRISICWGAMGDIYHEMGEKDKAYECYDKALKYNNQNYNVLNNYAYFLSEEQRDLLKAEGMASKVITKYPDNATYLDTYAWILYLEKSYVLAKFYQQRAIEKSDKSEDNTTLYEHWHEILKALGEDEAPDTSNAPSEEEDPE